MKRLFSLALLFFLSFATAFGLVKGQRSQRSLPFCFLIPEGYVGWTRVDFNVPDALDLPIEDGCKVVKIPESGRLQTSSRYLVDSRNNTFFYYSCQTKYKLEISGSPKNMIGHQFSGPGPMEQAAFLYRYVFIGPSDVFAKYQASDTRLLPKEPDGHPKVGAQNWLTPQELIRMGVKQP